MGTDSRSSVNQPRVQYLDNSTGKAANPLSPAKQWDEKLKERQQGNREMAEVLRHHGHEYSRLALCGTVIGYRKCHNKHIGWRKRSYCGDHHLCPICAAIENWSASQIYEDIINQIQNRPVLGHRFCFPTVTIATNGNYVGAVKTAKKALPRLWRDFLGGRKRKGTGGFSALEFGPKTGNLHAHICYYGPHISKGDLVEKWVNLTGSDVVEIAAPTDNADLLLRVDYRLKGPIDWESTTTTKEQKLFQWKAIGGRHTVIPYGLFRADTLSKWLGWPYQRIEPTTAAQRHQVEPCSHCGSTRSHFQWGSPEPDHHPS